jgi:flagellar basal body L-ring protein FlgH
MNTAKYAVSALALAMLVGAGCQSGREPGVKTNKLQQYTVVAADVETTARAAQQVFRDEKLMNVGEVMATRADGNVTAKKADGTEVYAKVARETDTSSTLTVRIGKLGDQKLGAEYAAKIKRIAEGSGSMGSGSMNSGSMNSDPTTMRSDMR